MHGISCVGTLLQFRQDSNLLLGRRFRHNLSSAACECCVCWRLCSISILAMEARTLLNNWFEERVMHDERVKDYIYKKQHGMLISDQIKAEAQAWAKPAKLSVHPDGKVHNADTMMIISQETGGALTIDPRTKSPRANGRAEVTTASLNSGPVLRSAWVVEAFDADESELILYNQACRLRSLASEESQLYLTSQAVNLANALKRTSGQAVFATPNNQSYEQAWKIVPHDIEKRLELEGQPISYNTPVVIVHAPTGQALRAETVRAYMQIGPGFATSAYTIQGHNKVLGLVKEQLGLWTADVPYRSEQTPNVFVLNSGADV